MPRTRPGTLIYRRDDGAEHFLQLNQPLTTLGRSESCDIVIDSPIVSRTHARIEQQHDRYVLADAGSANGTFLNGERLAQARQLSTNDTIWLGSSEVVLSFSDPDETLGVRLHSGPPPLLIDASARIVQVYGTTAQLTTLEYELMRFLAGQPRRVCTREECFQAVWGQRYDHATCEDALNACVARLRRNLRAAAAPAGLPAPPITTIKRIGFRLDSEALFEDAAPAPLSERAFGV